MSDLATGTATETIERTPFQVWAAISDISRMGEWSPECVAGRWIDGATGPEVGARFEGDNVAKIAGRTVKSWTTTSEVTVCEPGVCFEFVAEEYTTWRYDVTSAGSGSRVTESFSYEPKGVQGFIYNVLLQRRSAMTKGMARTLARIKAVLESEPT